MQQLVEYPLELASWETRALELEGEGPPLLLLHGWADSADTWRLVLDRLARENRRALALDLPGFGGCSPLDSERAILEQLDEFVAAAVAHVAPKGGTLLVGNSLGGTAALRAAERPQLGVAGVLAVAPAGLEMPRWFFLVERDPVVRALLASPLPVPGAVVRRVVVEVYRRLAFHRPGSVDAHVFSTFASHFGSKAAAASILASGRRVIAELRDPFQPERLACPVLLVWGRQDAMVLQTGAERMLDALAESRLEVIEDCGHCPQLEAPERLCELILETAAPFARAA